jgi:hypothetical protein
MTSFTNTLAPNFVLSDDERDLLQIAHRWVSTYCSLCAETTVPEPQGTVLEAWAIINMASILWGFPSYPADQVRASVPTPFDYHPRLYVLKKRLEAAEGVSAGRTPSA